jgi:hypothetical protein
MGHSLFLWLRCFAELDVNLYIWSPDLLHDSFLDLFECSKGTFLEAHSLNVFVNVGGVPSGHQIFNRLTLLLITFFFSGAILPSQSWKRFVLFVLYSFL